MTGKTKVPMRKKTAAKKELELIKLDIACGQNKKEGFTGVDIAPAPGVDVVHNLSFYPWPFADNSVAEIFCSHYIEHIPMAFWNEGNNYTVVPLDHHSVDAFFKFVSELHRVMAPGAKATLIAPYFQSERCWQDPTHRRAICNATMFYLSQDWLKLNRLDHYNTQADFEAVWGYDYEQEWLNKHEDARAYGTRHHWGVVRDIHVTLTKKPPPK
jgi:predicted SAM-dependent methyltransferase